MSKTLTGPSDSTKPAAIDSMQFIFPKDLHICMCVFCFDKIEFGACIEHENAFWE